jgi:hypothetical protein
VWASTAAIVAATPSGGWGIVLEAYLQRILANGGCCQLSLVEKQFMITNTIFWVPANNTQLSLVEK